MLKFVDDRPTIKLQRLQQVQLQLASDVIAFGQSRGLRPFLVAGSALGAWRDKGTIAWDDDVDIGMLREDYDAFVQAWQDQPLPGIFLQCWQSEPEYPFAFAKLRLDGTRVVEVAAIGEGHHHGIFVDLFPFDPLPQSAILRWVQRLALAAISLFVISYSREAARAATRPAFRLLRMAALAIRPVVPVRTLIRVRERLFRLAFAAKSDEVICFEMYGIQHSRITRIGRDALVPPMLVPFGTRQFPVPARCEEYLSAIFGDYRRLPPVEKRQPHHITDVDFGDPAAPV